jgi:hypothetical protein
MVGKEATNGDAADRVRGCLDIAGVQGSLQSLFCREVRKEFNSSVSNQGNYVREANADNEGKSMSLVLQQFDPVRSRQTWLDG